MVLHRTKPAKHNSSWPWKLMSATLCTFNNRSQKANPYHRGMYKGHKDEIRPEKIPDKSNKNGKWHEGEKFQLLYRTLGGVFTAMNKDEAFKYLGVIQSQGIDV